MSLLTGSSVDECVEVAHTTLPVVLAVADEQLGACTHVLDAGPYVHALAQLAALAAPQPKLHVCVLPRVAVVVDESRLVPGRERVECQLAVLAEIDHADRQASAGSADLQPSGSVV